MMSITLQIIVIHKDLKLELRVTEEVTRISISLTRELIENYITCLLHIPYCPTYKYGCLQDIGLLRVRLYQIMGARAVALIHLRNVLKHDKLRK